jgi:hypothetical protein
MRARVGGLFAAGALLAMGCGLHPSGTLIGESQHFRLYVDPQVTVPALADAGGYVRMKGSPAVCGWGMLPSGAPRVMVLVSGMPPPRPAPTGGR